MIDNEFIKTNREITFPIKSCQQKKSFIYFETNFFHTFYMPTTNDRLSLQGHQ